MRHPVSHCIDHLGSLRVPVRFMDAAITAMLVSAFFARGESPSHSPRMNSAEQSLEQSIEHDRQVLLDHPIYRRVTDLASLRIFMTSHVFAVWDFMSLAKSLQRSLTCVEVPWLPPRHTGTARLINSIILSEETDEVAPGRVVSHYELYLSAMEEVGASTAPIRSFVDALCAGIAWRDALEAAPIRGATARFVRHTIETSTETAVHEVAAAFLYGREDLVPQMFTRMLGHLESQPDSARCDSFRLYLQRHIDIDTDDHGPSARRMLRDLCGDDPQLWAQATAAASKALRMRVQLWNGVLAEIESGAGSVRRSSQRPVAPLYQPGDTSPNPRVVVDQ